MAQWGGLISVSTLQTSSEGQMYGEWGNVHCSIVGELLHWRDYWPSNHFALHFHSLMYLILWDRTKS